MKISYCITACNEHEELQSLADFLLKRKRDTDEVVLLLDADSVTEEVLEISKHPVFTSITLERLNRNFSNFKNQFHRLISGDYIFQIDADEIPSEDLIDSLPKMLEENPEVDLFLIPRINIVNGITQEHINKWRWTVNEQGWVNFPDYQTRIYRNSPDVYWAGNVHERITGFKSYCMLPAEESWCLIHEKNINKQEKQNQFYDSY